MQQNNNQHQSVDTIIAMQEFAYRARSPDSEPPERPEAGASGSKETEGEAELALDRVDEIEAEEAHDLQSKANESERH